MGDFNAKLARGPDAYVGRWCIHTHANAAGQQLQCLLEDYDLFAVSTAVQPPPGGRQVRSDDIRERLTQEDVLDTVLRKKKHWLKKIKEMSEERLAKRVYMEEMPGKRPRGRLRKRWEDDLTL